MLYMHVDEAACMLKDVDEAQCHSTNKQKQNNHPHKSKTSNAQSKSKFGKKLKLSVYSDSQGRGIWQHLDDIYQDVNCSNNVVMPNAPLLHVIKSAQQCSTRDDEDVAVLLGGTNDTLQNSLATLYKNLDSELKGLTIHKKVILSTIPTRYDEDFMDPIHNEIHLFNNYIRNLITCTDNLYLLDLDRLKRFHFSRHGLHLNYSGKKKIAYMIKDILNHIYFEDRPEGRKYQINQHFSINESNMRMLIDKYRGSEEVAFAHSISSDFKSPHHMSAGVAVSFREMCGRPTKSDRISNHLSLQATSGRASVYSLVTKPEYFMKPQLQDYELAFKHLMDDFKEKRLKHLVCTPVGCFRDRIQPEHFAEQICQFQKCTGATVEIVSHYQDSMSVLRNGLAHSAFNERLIQEISNNYISFNAVIQEHPTSPVPELSGSPNNEEAPLGLSKMAVFPPLATPPTPHYSVSVVQKQSNTRQSDVQSYSCDELISSDQSHTLPKTPISGTSESAFL